MNRFVLSINQDCISFEWGVKDIKLKTQVILLICIVLCMSLLSGCTKPVVPKLTDSLEADKEDAVYQVASIIDKERPLTVDIPGYYPDDWRILYYTLKKLKKAGYDCTGKILHQSTIKSAEQIPDEKFLGVQLNNGDLLLCTESLDQENLVETISKIAKSMNTDMRFAYRKGNPDIITHVFISDNADVYYAVAYGFISYDPSTPNQEVKKLTTEEIKALLAEKSN